MSRKFRKAMAIVALIFMTLFVVSLTVTMANPKLLNGSIGYVALFTGFVGIGIFVSIWLSDRAAKKREGQGSESAAPENNGDDDGAGNDAADGEMMDKQENAARDEDGND